jgi:hypothetical protein
VVGTLLVMAILAAVAIYVYKSKSSPKTPAPATAAEPEKKTNQEKHDPGTDPPKDNTTK